MQTSIVTEIIGQKHAPVTVSTMHKHIVDKDGNVLFETPNGEMVTSGTILNMAIDANAKIDNAVFHHWHFVEEHIGPAGDDNGVVEYTAYGLNFYKCHFIHCEFNDINMLNWSFACCNIFQNNINFCTMKKTRLSKSKFIGNLLNWCNVAYAKWFDCSMAHSKFVNCYVFQSIIFNLTHGSENSVDFSLSVVFALVTNMRIRNPHFVNILHQSIQDASTSCMDLLVKYPDSWVVLWHNQKRFPEWQKEMLQAE